MKKYIISILFLALLFTAAVCSAEGDTFSYRFADAAEASELLLSNRAYYNGFNQSDLDFRLQKFGGTLEEMEAFAADQTLEWTETEKTAVKDAMAAIEKACEEHGYTLPRIEEIVFAKTTMREESNAGAYTHGTQIYIGERLLSYGSAEEPAFRIYFQHIVAHELFHCLTRNDPDFRRDFYGILGFTVVEEDYDFSQEIDDIIISNPDVSHHNSYAAFEIDGEPIDCAVIFTTGEPFTEPGDSFFDNMVTGLVPVGDLSVMYTSEDAANFWDVFGENTEYVIDHEETLADNFAFTIVYGLDGLEYKSPQIIEAIDAYLRGR